ncbi:hypothetical protein HDV63DRAFT_366311 [Trichoderma sp. SZMC 28014]
MAIFRCPLFALASTCGAHVKSRITTSSSLFNIHQLMTAPGSRGYSEIAHFSLSSLGEPIWQWLSEVRSTSIGHFPRRLNCLIVSMWAQAPVT